jgi:hypothetical protein
MSDEPKCIMCGKCCHYILDGKLVKCKHLVRLPSGKTLCRIYKTRLGTSIGPGRVCAQRERRHENFDGCPYNRPEWNKE